MKKIKLYGPDGYKYYWHDVSTEKLSYSKRIQGGGSVMIWGGIIKGKKLPLSIVKSTMNSTNYCDLLNSTVKTFIEDHNEHSLVFQQDNTPCHRAKNTMKWFEDNDIKLLDWSTRSPDLNPMENVWGMLSFLVYGDGRQYDTTHQLKKALLDAWDALSQVSFD